MKKVSALHPLLTYRNMEGQKRNPKMKNILECAHYLPTARFWAKNETPKCKKSARIKNPSAAEKGNI